MESNYHERGLIEIETGRRKGCYPMAQVKQMYCDQHGATHDEFDIMYSWKKIYKKIYDVAAYMDVDILKTVSHTGNGTTKLFPLVVLKECFKDINFDELEK